MKKIWDTGNMQRLAECYSRYILAEISGILYELRSIIPLFVCGKFISESCFCCGCDWAATVATKIFLPSLDGYG